MMTTREAAAIVAHVARQTGVAEIDITGESRVAHVVRARDQVVAILADRGCPAKKIGRLMLRDHSTILHSLKKQKRSAS